jgi:hypothetical protein
MMQINNTRAPVEKTVVERVESVAMTLKMLSAYLTGSWKKHVEQSIAELQIVVDELKRPK